MLTYHKKDYLKNKSKLQMSILFHLAYYLLAKNNYSKNVILRQIDVKTLQNHILRFILQNADSAQSVDDTKLFISGQDIQYKILESTC